MGRKREKHQHLPRNVYVRRGKFQLVHRDGHAKSYSTLADALQAWGAEYGGAVGETMSDVILDYQIKVLPALAKSTQREYLKALHRLNAVFGHMRLREIRPTHIYQYQTARVDQGARVIVNRDLATMSAVCNHAIRLGHADINPCRQVRRRPEKPRTRYVTDEELAIVYALASDWMQRAIKMTAITGIRLGDLCRISDANRTDKGFLYEQNKTGRKILVEWNDDLRDAAHPPPVSYEGFTTAWQRLMRKALENGLRERFTFHDLRAKAGSEAEDIRILGHADLGFAERVYQRKPGQFKAGSFSVR